MSWEAGGSIVEPPMGPRAAGVQGRSVVLLSSRSAVLILKDSRLLLPSQPGVGCLPAVIHPHQQRRKSRCIWIGVRDFFFLGLPYSAVQCTRVCSVSVVQPARGLFLPL